MWIYSVFAWFVSPTYACDLWEKWDEEKRAREAAKNVAQQKTGT